MCNRADVLADIRNLDFDYIWYALFMAHITLMPTPLRISKIQRIWYFVILGYIYCLMKICLVTLVDDRAISLMFSKGITQQSHAYLQNKCVGDGNTLTPLGLISRFFPGTEVLGWPLCNLQLDSLHYCSESRYISSGMVKNCRYMQIYVYLYRVQL